LIVSKIIGVRLNFGEACQTTRKKSLSVLKTLQTQFHLIYYCSTTNSSVHKCSNKHGLHTSGFTTSQLLKIAQPPASEVSQRDRGKLHIVAACFDLPPSSGKIPKLGGIG